MAKLANGRYHSGQRTREWLKVKASQEQEVVIVGFTQPKGQRRVSSAHWCSRCVTASSWKYAGRAGTGLHRRRHCAKLHGKLVPLITKKEADCREGARSEASTIWVKPKLVAEVKFTEWTAGRRDAPPGISGLAHRQKGDRCHQRNAETIERSQAHRPALSAVNSYQGGACSRLLAFDSSHKCKERRHEHRPRYLRQDRPGVKSLAQGRDGAARHARPSSRLFDLARGAARFARSHRGRKRGASRRAIADAFCAASSTKAGIPRASPPRSVTRRPSSPISPRSCRARKPTRWSRASRPCSMSCRSMSIARAP